MEYRRKLKRRLWIYAVLAAIGCAALTLGFLGLTPPCVFYSQYGVLCPSCGATRSLLELIRLRPAAAVERNPVFALAFYPIAGLFACEDLAVTIGNLRKGWGRPSLLQFICGWKDQPPPDLS